MAANKPPERESLPVINCRPKIWRKNYLGFSGVVCSDSTDQGKVIIIEIFSMYCPMSEDAPGVNELYRLIENNAGVKNKIKLIGIAQEIHHTK